MALYDAFVSYSYANDKSVASALQTTVQKLGKLWYRRRALRLFATTPASPPRRSFGRRSSGRSEESLHFILLASPQAAASKWVNKEVAYWLDHNSIDTLLIGVTHGELFWDDTAGDFAARRNLPLPSVLAGRFPSEPSWVDLRAYRDGADKRDAKLTELAADFAAAIRGIPKEDLLSQEVRQQRRALTLAWSAVGLLLVLAAGATGAGVLAYRASSRRCVPSSKPSPSAIPRPATSSSRKRLPTAWCATSRSICAMSRECDELDLENSGNRANDLRDAGGCGAGRCLLAAKPRRDAA